MEENKFDKKIKGLFEDRTIQPSTRAWGAVQEQLNQPSKNNTRSRTWLLMAASVAAILFVSIFYWSQEEVTLPVNEVVEQPVESEPKIHQESNRVIEKILENEKETLASRPQTIEGDKLEQSSSPRKTSPEALLNEKAVNRNVVEYVPIEKIPSNNPVIDAKVEELIAEIKQIELNRTALTDAEVDSLLSEARNEILNTRIKKSDGSVDAMALLADVEMELDRSFRDELFDALKDRFIRVRTALADRNQ